MDDESFITRAEHQLDLKFKKNPRILYGDVSPNQVVKFDNNTVDDAFVELPMSVLDENIRKVILLHELRENLLIQNNSDKDSAHKQAYKFEKDDMQKYNISKEEKCKWLKKLRLKTGILDCISNNTYYIGGTIVGIIGLYLLYKVIKKKAPAAISPMVIDMIDISDWKPLSEDQLIYIERILEHD